MYAGGDLYWAEQDSGVLRYCKSAYTSRGLCSAASHPLLSGLNCPQDFVFDFTRGHVYVVQYGGGTAADRALSCMGTARITRFDLGLAADGSSAPLDVLTSGMVTPTFLAIDPLYVDPLTAKAGLLFWSDAGRDGGSVMRLALDGTELAQVMHLSSPSGVAVDTARQALYVTQQARGAAVAWSSYDGRWQKYVSSFSFYEPRGLAVDPSDGSARRRALFSRGSGEVADDGRHFSQVLVVEYDTFEPGCDPTANGGYGSVTCGRRNLGRISKIGCEWRAHATVDGAPPAPFQCCCAEEGEGHRGCTLDCPPMGSPPPPPPSLPPPMAPGEAGGNYTVRDQTPTPMRDYRHMISDNETLLFVGGYVHVGTAVISWGDPTHVRAVPATRLPPALSGLPPSSPRPLGYGYCMPGERMPAQAPAQALALTLGLLRARLWPPLGIRRVRAVPRRRVRHRRRPLPHVPPRPVRQRESGHVALGRVQAVPRGQLLAVPWRRWVHHLPHRRLLRRRLRAERRGGSYLRTPDRRHRATDALPHWDVRRARFWTAVRWARG